ncbi:MAG: DUF4097 family beta strand repeat protein [Clostridia bacterium]|nr:DUF4097 family beta strand repeat protein [Clostridia bacterium]
MTKTQKIIKYCAIALAVLLIVSILSGILHAFAALSFLFSDEKELVGETKIYSLSDLETVRNLEISIGAAALEIQNGETFALESNHRYLTAKVKNGTLLIEENIPFWVRNASGVKVILTVPEEFYFHHADIETGAGTLSVQALYTKELSMELGAGETIFENLTVTEEAEIQTGVGKFTIFGGQIAELDLEVGVGDVCVTTALLKEGEFDCGIGNTEIIFIGRKEDYCIAVNKGIGAATVDGKTVSNSSNIGNGSVRAQINGGIGDIEIQFISEK